MFPIRDENPQIRKPVVVYALILLNALAWVLLQGAGLSDALPESICQFGVIPADLLGQVPASVDPRMCAIDGQPNFITLLSTMFMHGGWMHILGNMWFLWIFGDNVEDAMGPMRFLAFYLLGGACATAAQVIAEPSSTIPMVGASGAIGAVMGGYIVLYPKVNVHVFFFIKTFAIPAFLMLGYWIGVQFFGGFMSGSQEGGTAFWAHIGGFVAGAAFVHVFKSKKLLEEHPFYGWSQKEHKDPTWKPVQHPSSRA